MIHPKSHMQCIYEPEASKASIFCNAVAPVFCYRTQLLEWKYLLQQHSHALQYHYITPYLHTN